MAVKNSSVFMHSACVKTLIRQLGWCGFEVLKDSDED